MTFFEGAGGAAVLLVSTLLLCGSLFFTMYDPSFSAELQVKMPAGSNIPPIELTNVHLTSTGRIRILTQADGVSCKVSSKSKCNGLIEFQYHPDKRDEFLNGSLFRFMYAAYLASPFADGGASGSGMLSTPAQGNLGTTTPPGGNANGLRPLKIAVGNNFGIGSCESTNPEYCPAVKRVFVSGLQDQCPETGKLKFMAATAWVYPTLGLAALLFTVMYFNSTSMEGSTGMMHKTWLVILHTAILVIALVHMAHMESLRPEMADSKYRNGFALYMVISMLAAVCIVMSSLLSASAYKTLTDAMMANFL